jgi:hypothetical protein
VEEEFSEVHSSKLTPLRATPVPKGRGRARFSALPRP